MKTFLQAKSNIAYTDDLTILGSTKPKPINPIETLETEARQFGLETNQKKTKYKRVGRKDGNGEEHLKTHRRVPIFNYLRTRIE